MLAVITDRKIAKDTTVDATYTPQFFMPDVYSVQNYYAFGQTMPKWSTSAPVNDPTRYRFGFNGKEDDDEWSKQDYGFRIYDARVARFLSVDPIAKNYPELTPYQFASNTPIMAIDLDGLEMFFASNGSLLGKIGNSTQVRLVDEKNVAETSKYIDWANDKSKNGIKYKKYNTSVALNLSREVNVDNSSADLKKLWTDSKDGNERTGYVVLDIEKAELSFKTVNVRNGNLFAEDLYAAGESFGGNKNQLVIANAHTHPAEALYLKKFTDQQIFDTQYSVPEADGNTAKKRGARYTIGVNNVDFYSPGGKKASKNNVTTRSALESGKFNLPQHALIDFGKRKQQQDKIKK